MLSSANRRILDWMFSLMSLMYSKKSIGPRTDPCGTPDVTSVMSDRAPLTETRCLRFDRKDVIQLCVLLVIPYELSLDRRRLCGILSKALAKSRRIASVWVLLSNAVIQSWTVSISWYSQDSPDWNPCWKWRIMSCLCRCFHMLLTIMCSITLQRMHVSEMAL